jgi:tryptophan-rich sensory protein
MIINKHISLLGFIIITFTASAIGAFSTRISKEPWYSSINKPSFNPPDWIFAPVWTTLYIFMAVAIWLIWTNPKKNKKIFYVYFSHLFINATWSIIFFSFYKHCLNYFFYYLVNKIIFTTE